MALANEKRIKRMVAFQDRGLLSETELVETLLLEFCEVVDTNETVTLFNSLPTGLRSAIFARLLELRNCDFKWRPFMIGSGFDENGLARLSGQLAELFEKVCEGK